MITSMREHKGYLYLGGIMNNRIGRYKLATPIRTSSSTTSVGASRHDRGNAPIRRLDPGPRRGLDHHSDLRRRAEAQPDAGRAPRSSAEFDDASDIAADGDGILVADGTRVVRVAGGEASEVARFDRARHRAVCALPGRRHRGRARTARTCGSRAGALDGFASTGAGERALPCRQRHRLPGRWTPRRHRRLAAAARRHWVHDLMGRGAQRPADRGRSARTARRASWRAASNMPSAPAPMDGDILVSESWRHRLVAVGERPAARRC